jgi:predicted transporter
MSRLKSATVATVYFCLPLIISLIIDLLGNALGSVLTTVTDFNGIIGASQAVVSIILLAAGMYTIKTWSTSKKNVSRRTSLYMVFPCPGTIITMFTTSALLIIGGMDSLYAGLIIGGIFVFFIVAGDVLVKKLHIKRDPKNFGSVMLLFGVLYVFSVLFVPAYIPVSEMDIPVQTTPFVELVPGIILMLLAILFGYLMKTYTINKTMR